MIDKQLLRMRFSKQAKTYDEYANVQKKMAKKLFDSLPKMMCEQKMDILEIGCGTGFLTKLLNEAFPKARITAVDLAPGMIEVAQERMNNKECITFLCGDIEEMTIDGSYDFIVSNATFQWLNNLDTVINRLCSLLKPDGRLLFSTFGNKTFQELHTSYEHAKEKLQLPIISSPGQSFYSLEKLYQICKQELASSSTSSFEITGTEQLELEHFQTVREFFTSIKKIGANNSNKERSCQHPSFFRELMNFYEINYRDEMGVRATYHCLFINIKRKKESCLHST
ncbi:malonyl-ACP O-methyltransferase BioC [Bacillus methanolicus]|uniref:Malonyl-[acyl-carrier protein] O-methyltransferase n=1 Tax=Bacillus methanolicus (strain MGA3 / ATCC 53907) TaxID=796606 RepID=I3DU37_BACMM|nr:malonyl-ACP O-methyltransferase BioC [Bacillus methanolicus]AIE59856.1 Malonyl-CoA O-methyltransferase BioC [Bacillus methanolicus MGA3]EIJ77758.1 biotin biosynthesis protein BioC [Bacillus methanolicus MGA3]